MRVGCDRGHQTVSHVAERAGGLQSRLQRVVVLLWQGLLSGGDPYAKKKSVLCCHADPTGHSKSMAKRCRQAHMETCSPVDCAGGLPWTWSSTSDEY